MSVFDMGKNIPNFKDIAQDYLSKKMAMALDDELMKLAGIDMPSTTATEQTATLTLETLREAEDKLRAFVPEIWSKKLVNKYFDAATLSMSWPKFEDLNGRSRYMKNLSKQIREMADKGMTPEEIAEKIDPEPDTVKILKTGAIGRIDGFKMYPWKTWRLDP